MFLVYPGAWYVRTPYASFFGLPPTMVMKVNIYTIKIRKTLPKASQNSASPYHLTTNALMQLKSLLGIE